ncbi:hypothetical protein NMG60_11019520 [Bertholletia excelsa]
MMEGSASSSMTDPVESMQGKDVFLPDDVAWADSCLVKDCEIPATNLNSIIDVLAEIRTSQPESFELFARRRVSLPGKTKIKIFSPAEAKQTPPDPGETLSGKQVEQNGDNKVFTLKKIDGLKPPFLPSYEEDMKDNGNADHPSLSAVPEELSSKDIFRVWDLDTPPVLGETLSDDQVEQNGDNNVFTLEKIDELKSPFLPSYNEDIKENNHVDDPSLSAVPEEPSRKDIFRVWDFYIPEEEDELIKQFNEALAGSSLQPTPPIPDDSAEWKDLKDKSINDLVAGISDLSLGQDSG